MDEQKKAIRKIINTRKKSLSQEWKNKISAQIFLKLEQLEIFKTSKLIMAYWSLSEEVSTHEFIQKWYKTKTILLPAVMGNDIQLREFEGVEQMEAGEAFGIHEPTKKFEVLKNSIDLIIVPGIAFDSKNNRLGRGGGYYDRFLPQTQAFKLGVCFDFQMLEEVPVTANDVRMDKVIF